MKYSVIITQKVNESPDVGVQLSQTPNAPRVTQLSLSLPK